MDGAAMAESRWRSLLKGLTWRLVATATTVVIALMVTGEVGHALAIGSVEFVAKFGVYYLHERAWARVPLGTIGNLMSRQRLLTRSSKATRHR